MINLNLYCCAEFRLDGQGCNLLDLVEEQVWNQPEPTCVLVVWMSALTQTRTNRVSGVQNPGGWVGWLC